MSAEPRRWTKSAASAPASLSSKEPIIVAGPTGAGKSVFAARLAHRLGGEIIGADAYQVYRGLEILTSQPTAEMRALAPHHLIGILEPSEAFDAARFCRLAREKITEIQNRNHVPLLVGGSGLYLKALTHGLEEIPSPDPIVRKELLSLSPEELLIRLDAADPSARQYIDVENPRRVLRALEIQMLTGKPASELRKAWASPDTPGFRGLLLVRERVELHERIASIVEAMFAQGVVEEVRKVTNPGPTARMAIGLREIQAFLRGESSEEVCREAMMQATRRYAKRQLTWFRNQFRFSPIDLTGLHHNHESEIIALQALGVAA